ncbi:MAG: FtsW/RodA/SpoVE family cell cycle protein [Actinomycetia bacterium]|nr:FtsW/RodA/SpoVE family cell cycle protein [Actinomycetes bacterium]MCP4222661.1 FtsW/RodA/SpoVE family cell cycle protein [Actinomycetes bacterium]MCP5034827.1 FtsW/RodA/SpoVE family cell cycle protein [Actinomycetes bacterium]
MRARNLELSLLVLGMLVTVVSYATLNLEETTDVQARVIGFFIIVVVLLIGAHLVLRYTAPNADPLLLPLAALLNGLGYVVIARIDPGLADSQAAWTFIGIGAFSATLLLIPDLKWVANYRYTLALAGVALLMLPLIPGLGRNINGARIWLAAGPFSIQPGEFAKVVLAAFLAGYLVDKRELLSISNRQVLGLNLPAFKHLGPLLLAWSVALMVMVLQRDLGSSLLFFTLFLVMTYVATSRAAYVVIGLVMFSAGSYVSWSLFDHVQRRVDIWFDPFADPKGAGFQIAEAYFALADGGITGTGLGNGLPHKIPFAATDMIFAAVGEELGLLGATAVLAAFMFFVSSGFRVAATAPGGFEKLLAAGLTALLGFQAFIIIGGVLRVLPLTGVTLPYMSYGGSSLISNYIVLALLIRISDQTPDRIPDEAGAQQPALV